MILQLQRSCILPMSVPMSADVSICLRERDTTTILAILGFDAPMKEPYVALGSAIHEVRRSDQIEKKSQGMWLLLSLTATHSAILLS